MNDRINNLLVDSFLDILVPGIVYTIPLALLSFLFGLVIAIIVAVAQMKKNVIITYICRFYVWIFRGTPLLVQLFIVFYGLPNVGITLDSITSALIALSLNVGAYASETIRGSINAIDKGQLEASLSVGMKPIQAYTHIIMPQALYNSIPPLFNTFISLVKDTSLASSITVCEMFMATQQIAARTYEPLILYLEVAFIYLMFCTILTKAQALLEKKLSFI